MPARTSPPRSNFRTISRRAPPSRSSLERGSIISGCKRSSRRSSKRSNIRRIALHNWPIKERGSSAKCSQPSDCASLMIALTVGHGTKREPNQRRVSIRSRALCFYAALFSLTISSPASTTQSPRPQVTRAADRIYSSSARGVASSAFIVAALGWQSHALCGGSTQAPAPSPTPDFRKRKSPPGFCPASFATLAMMSL
jgi:hypothetical protein